MKQHIKYAVLGFTLTFVSLVAVAYVLSDAFLTDGFINNGFVGNVVNYDFTDLQLLGCTVLMVLILAALAVYDYITRRRMPYVLRGNEAVISASIGVLAATLPLTMPWSQPGGYQNLLGFAIVLAMLLFVRHRLLRKV